jgi:hypothetical protein
MGLEAGMRKTVKQFLLSHFLAVFCFLGPLLLGFGSLDLAARVLNYGSLTQSGAYEFLSQRDLRAEAAAKSTSARKSATETPAGNARQSDGITEDIVRATFMARDVFGRTSYAIGSAFLYLASFAAMAFGFGVVARRHSVKRACLVLGVVAAVTRVLAGAASGFDLLRPMAIENIIGAAEKHASFPRSAPGEQFTRIASWVFPGLDKFGEPTVTALVRIDTFAGVLGVGMLLAALASVSVLEGSHSTARKLRERRAVIRIVLALGAIVFVVSVIASRALIEWPLALLSNAQQKAVAPFGEALNWMFGATCTLCLIAAVGPAFVAFVLDRQVLRANQPTATPTPVPVPVQSAGWKAGTADSSDDGLSFTPMRSVTTALAILSPLLASPVLQIIASLLKISHQ